MLLIWIFWTSTLSFKARMGPLACVIYNPTTVGAELPEADEDSSREGE